MRGVEFAGDRVAFVDIAPDNAELIDLTDHTSQLLVLDHHITAQARLESDQAVRDAMASDENRLVFDMNHSGAMLAWLHFHPNDPAPDLLRYVEDQDLWNWKLDESREINAAIGSYPNRFEVWSDLASRPIGELAREGAPIVRANRVEVERIVNRAAPIAIGPRRVESVNSSTNRAAIGHALSERERYGESWGCVYRIDGDRVHATLYSIGDFDVSEIATGLGGGGHKNAAGFSVPIAEWVRDYVC
jgi:oligoribonuclease NrnB/cAMP/cGMP phosphodiesterase (DHH superfamily)